jgi:hypothetical protein
VATAATVTSWSTGKRIGGEARSKREGRWRRDGVHRGRGEMVLTASISGGVATVPAAEVDRRQWAGGVSVSLEKGRGRGRERKGAQWR